MFSIQFDKSNVELNHGDWNWKENLVMVRNFSEWRVKYLSVQDNRRPELLKDIAHITFTNLTSLQLSENNIESVEELAFLFMPKIRWLYLERNRICSIKPTRKASWPQLEHLDISENGIHDHPSLTQACLPKLTSFAANFQSKRGVDMFRQTEKTLNKFLDPHFCSKLESPSFQNLYIDQTKFAFFRSVKNVLQEKWYEIEII